MFFDIFKFEINYHRRQYLFYVLAGVFFLLSFLATTTSSVAIVDGTANININSPYTILRTLSSLSFLALIGAIAFTANGVLRDHDMEVAELFLATPVRKFDYMYGRFFGSFVFAFGIYFAALLGVLLGEFMPWLDQERVGPVNLYAYWYSSWAIALPDLFLASAMFFCLATVTRSMMATYAGLVVLLMLIFVLNTFTERGIVEVTSILDPFGDTAVEQVTRYWTVFEKNTRLPPLEGALLFNRLLWLAIGLFFLAIASPLYPFTINQRQKKHKNQMPIESPKNAVKQADFAHVKVQQSFDFSARLQQYFSQSRLEVKNIVKSVPFVVLLLLGLFSVTGNALGNLGNIFGTQVYPTTAIMIDIINAAFSLSLIAVLFYYSGELMVRERNVYVSEIIDAMPFPNWVMIAAKLTGLAVVIVAMLSAAMLAAIGVQVYKGYYDINVLHYLSGLFFFFQFPIYLMMVMSIFFYVLTRNKFVAMALMILYVIFTLAAPQMGFEHYLYRVRMLNPVYSEFTGYGQNLLPYLWQTVYWGLFGCLLLLVVHLLWPRGIEDDWRNRLKVLRQRLDRPVMASLATVTVLFIVTGGWIFYNTTVLNDYMSSRDRERLQVQYEKSYKQYQYLNQPSITDVYAEIDIFPERRDVLIRGRYDVSNTSDQPISTLHLAHLTYLDVQKLDVPGATLEAYDEDVGYRIYRLEPAMQPGDSMVINFDIAWTSPGFANSGHSNKISSNGTFFNNSDAFPQIGYRSNFELDDNNKRRQNDLPPLQRMADINDKAALMRSGLGGAGRVNFEALLSTSADQTAIAPGYLQKEWLDGDRRYFHYKMDEPIWNFYSFMSAEYQVRKDSWNDVAIEVYYLHDYNVDAMIRSARNSLKYFSENFSPYQYQQFRILEFPRFQGTFAQAFPNTIPFSEGIGFIADLRDPEKIDYVYYVTAHELAHQWWGHQVLGADVQGSTMIVESLAQYSALMAMEKEYGPEQMKRFLEFELDRYLQGRGAEQIDEMPLFLVENQPYVHYRKGSVVLYALKDALGEDVMNRALANFLGKFAFKQAPYPTSRDLIASIRDVAPAEYDDLITDLLEKIVLFDLQHVDSSVTELPDGRYEVLIEVAAHKYEADGTGQETEVPVRAFVDIGIFGAEQGEAKFPEIIYLQKHEITQNTHSFKVIVDRKPLTAGIDPFNKMIDRNPADNVAAVK